MAYNVGDTVTLEVTIKNKAGALSDPTTLTLLVEDPGGNQATYTYALGQITKVSTGVYSKDLVMDEAGWWYYRWTSTGTPALCEEGRLEVRTHLFT